MSGVLLDTNILSELVRPSPETSVVAWMRSVRRSYLSVITLHELKYGIRLLRQGRRRRELEQAMFRLLDEYSDSILQIDSAVAENAALQRAEARLHGRTIHLADALIGATAIVNQLSLASRNTSDFDGMEIDLVNPWDC